MHGTHAHRRLRREDAKSMITIRIPDIKQENDAGEERYFTAIVYHKNRLDPAILRS